jgi:hypothetical protein
LGENHDPCGLADEEAKMHLPIEDNRVIGRQKIRKVIVIKGRLVNINRRIRYENKPLCCRDGRIPIVLFSVSGCGYTVYRQSIPCRDSNRKIEKNLEPKLQTIALHCRGVHEERDQGRSGADTRRCHPYL